MDRVRQWSSRFQGRRGAKQSKLDLSSSRTALTNGSNNGGVDDGYEMPMNEVDHSTSKKSDAQLQAHQLPGSEAAVFLAPSDAGENGSSRSQSPNPNKSHPLLTRKLLGRFTSSWQTGAKCWLAAAAFAFLINLFTSIGLVSTYSIDGEGIGVMMEGQCSRVKSASLWVHVAINILSTALLTGSNYCMQVSSSPTRDEVDRAHREGKWLDIGIHSIRNLFSIGSKRVWLWLVLALSSAPLHLMYNSIIFQSLNTQDYQVFVVTEEFLTTDGSWDISSTAFSGEPQATETETGANLLRLKQSASSLERLSAEDCIRSYGKDIVSERRNLLAVTPNDPNLLTDDSLLVWYEATTTDSLQSYLWMCYNSHFYTMNCDTSELIANMTRDSWKLMSSFGEAPIEYCLSERIEESCRLQFSVPIMIVVTICNLGKVLAMLLILWGGTAKPLTNVGDAAASFLEAADHTTAGLCLSSKKDFPKGTAWTKSSLLSAQKGRQFWKPTRSWWFAIPGIKRWILTLSPGIIALALSGKLLELGLSNLGSNSRSTDLSSLASMGFGAINSYSVINDSGARDRFLPTSLTGFILLANSPQLIISIIYFAFNALFTCMLLAREWNSYTYKRKPLRVTDPKGEQRSTYYLSLPYTYAIPLMALSGLLHWLISQSFFLVRFDLYLSTGEFSQSISNCGYSCIAIIAAIIVGSILVVSSLALGCRKYKPGIPAAGSCSAAISAACHPPPGDKEVATLPVQWGAVELLESSNGVGHCSFTSWEVSMPVAGRVYAGVE